MIPLPEYAKIKDNYCIAYFGNCKEYLVQLRLLRPAMESFFPGIRVFLCCNDDYLYVLKNEPRILSKSDLLQDKSRFAYVRELIFNGADHPVEEIVLESDIPIRPIRELTPYRNPAGGVAALLTQCNHPVKSLTGTQTQKALQFAKDLGCDVLINQGIHGCDVVIGVECELLYEAAAQGIPIVLIPTGLGENLCKTMFPGTQILAI